MAQTGGNDNTPPAKIWPRGKKQEEYLENRVSLTSSFPHTPPYLPFLPPLGHYNVKPPIF